MENALNQPVYPVATGTLSLSDLLRVFSNPEHHHGGVSRYSDLHIRTGDVLRYRYDGDLMAVEGGMPVSVEMAKQLILPLLTADDRRILEVDSQADVDCSFTFDDTNTNFRINVFRDRKGLAAVIRVLPAWIPEIRDLGFPDQRVLDDIVNAQQGMVIVTGITGSGKSTTIASILKHIAARRPVHIVSLEDPVEFTLPSGRALISQREIGTHVPSFADGLRSALREDPDVIFVGEIRDRESASLALTAAETGHLVFSTLHTRDARGAITRLVDLYPEDRHKELCVQLSFGLAYIIAQRLVQRSDGKGRRIALEVLKNSYAVSAIIRAGNWQQLYGVMETQMKDGMLTCEKHLALLFKSGQIDRQEALSQANDPIALAQLI